LTKSNYNYLNISPVNIHNPKIQKRGSLVLLQEPPKNNYNQIYNIKQIVHYPYLKNNSMQFASKNNQNMDNNQVHNINIPISKSPVPKNNLLLNNIQINSPNINVVKHKAPISISSSMINYNTNYNIYNNNIYNNTNYNNYNNTNYNNINYNNYKNYNNYNSIYNNNNNNNINNNFFTPQKIKKSNSDIMKNINIDKQNNHIQNTSQNINHINYIIVNKNDNQNENKKQNINLKKVLPEQRQLFKDKIINITKVEQNTKPMDKIKNKISSLGNINHINSYKNISTNSNTSNYNTDKSSKISSEPNDNFEPKEFLILKQIGEGTYGKIYLTLWIKNEQKYAMKKEKIKGLEGLRTKREKTKIIMNFIKNTGCNGVIKIYGDLVKNRGNGNYFYYVLMEMAEKDWEQELFDRQKYKKYYSEKELFIIISQLIKTLSLLQYNHITHRDVKPQNILICQGIYKLTDFGEAKILKRTGVIASRVRGTELYMAPILYHAFRHKMNQILHNTYKSDVFSLGMCILYAATLNLNYVCDIREVNDMRIIKKYIVKYLSSRYSFKLINILFEMLEIEENYRPDFMILEKKYFS
jgi:hypothetical protein